MSDATNYRRMEVVSDIDLNRVPVVDENSIFGNTSREQDEPSTQMRHDQTLALLPMEATDDDVIEISARAFAKAIPNFRRNRRRTIDDVIDVYIEEEEEQHPKKPLISCPICMGPFVEEMTTKCGHIFCKTCIKDAIKAQAKCPTCRKKITSVRQLIRVYLPTTG